MYWWLVSIFRRIEVSVFTSYFIGHSMLAKLASYAERGSVSEGLTCDSSRPFNRLLACSLVWPFGPLRKLAIPFRDIQSIII
jgi:hypothetical protein